MLVYFLLDEYLISKKENIKPMGHQFLKLYFISKCNL